MALGTNYARTGRKQDLIIKIQMEMSYQNPDMTANDIRKVTKKFPRLTVSELQERYKAVMDYRKCSASLNHSDES